MTNQGAGARVREQLPACLLALLAGLLASRVAWTCDDAFISYRYAENLVEGRGAVFNVGERVEGFTNPLWTLLIAAGMAIGVEPVRWSLAWGIAAYALAIYALARDKRGPFPLAASVGAALPIWHIYATSGLETSAFTTLALLGLLGLARVLEGKGESTLWPGVLLGLASITRPDGVLFAVVGGGALLALRPLSLGAALRYAAGFASAWGPMTLARFLYYGSLVPNTYYAKSAELAWWSQGARYLWLFLLEHGALYLGVALIAALVARALVRRERLVLGRGELSALFVVAYGLYVTRVGGDFMYGRLLVPTLPFALIALEEGAARLASNRRVAAPLVATFSVGLALALPRPVTDRVWRYGIADEWACYSPERVEVDDRRGEVLRRAFAGLPARFVFLGSEARIVFRSGVSTAVEAETGLTDSVIAKSALKERGRPGHEKHASVEYLLDQRNVQLAFSPRARKLLKLERVIPILKLEIEGVELEVLSYDPELMAALKARGAHFVSFTGELDKIIADLPHQSDRSVRSIYKKLKRFYFDHVSDPSRQAAFEARLGAEAPRATH